jgi:hypothetical protein
MLSQSSQSYHTQQAQNDSAVKVLQQCYSIWNDPAVTSAATVLQHVQHHKTSALIACGKYRQRPQISRCSTHNNGYD